MGLAAEVGPADSEAPPVAAGVVGAAADEVGAAAEEVTAPVAPPLRGKGRNDRSDRFDNETS